MASACKSAFVLGYTGETGKALVQALVKDQHFRKVRLIGRRKVELPVEIDSRFEQVVVDFEKLGEHKDAFTGYDVGFCCMGTTRAKAGPAHFVRVDRDYVVESGQLAKDAGCQHFLIVTATGADKNSMFLYNKTKGEAEEMLKEIKFPTLTILKPGLLLCPRVESRFFEEVAKVMFKPITAAFPTRFSVHVEILARAMVHLAKCPPNESVHVLDNKAIHRVATENK
ncbi:oxidoreductase HTATIP2-like [Mya arenaria]|uniref:oxidoreductase HTATIP2-like n=1 Tax=Mya arenaria TaxID=6604 RepID=UPI0022E1B8B7|nr:oxidoreductase HTATIP2-like [Mya arenaria]